MVLNQGRNNKIRGASFEREIADLFGGKRAGTKGLPDEEHEDIIIEGFRIQCKRRKRLSLSSEWWDKVSIEAKKYKQVPLLATREDRGKSLVLMRAEHLSSIVDLVKGKLGDGEWTKFLFNLSQE